MGTTRQDVIDRERHFHNERFAQERDPRVFLNIWYETIRHGQSRQDEVILLHSKDADVLEYGCSDGGGSIDNLRVHTIAKSLTGIDISDVAVDQANAHAEQIGATNARFIAMDGEAMSFDDASFDFIYGRGIIHHLNLDRCYAELARVLRSGGRAVFFEPMGYNPVLNAYRDRTPDIRTPDEHPLLAGDFKLARGYFSNVSVEYFGLFTVGSALMPKAMRKFTYSVGKALDSVILKVPYVNRLAWYCLVTLTK